MFQAGVRRNTLAWNNLLDRVWVRPHSLFVGLLFKDTE